VGSKAFIKVLNLKTRIVNPQLVILSVAAISGSGRFQ
jgi:hypothetical protein